MVIRISFRGKDRLGPILPGCRTVPKHPALKATSAANFKGRTRPSVRRNKRKINSTAHPKLLLHLPSSAFAGLRVCRSLFR